MCKLKIFFCTFRHIRFFKFNKLYLNFFVKTFNNTLIWQFQQVNRTRKRRRTCSFKSVGDRSSKKNTADLRPCAIRAVIMICVTLGDS